LLRCRLFGGEAGLLCRTGGAPGGLSMCHLPLNQMICQLPAFVYAEPLYPWMGDIPRHQQIYPLLLAHRQCRSGIHSNNHQPRSANMELRKRPDQSKKPLLTQAVVCFQPTEPHKLPHPRKTTRYLVFSTHVIAVISFRST
jgi:hypothetical protein